MVGTEDLGGRGHWARLRGHGMHGAAGGRHRDRGSTEVSSRQLAGELTVAEGPTVPAAHRITAILDLVIRGKAPEAHVRGQDGFNGFGRSGRGRSRH